MVLLSYLIAAATAYLIGSIPTGFLVAKAKGVDIRTAGSGNIGATNVFRTLGTIAGISVLAVDFLKGLLACTLVPGLVARWAPGTFTTGAFTFESLALVCGIFAVLGHNYTCGLWFRGGKGIATSAGVLVALVPRALLIILGVWIVVFALTRYVSLASIAASFSLPFAVWITGGSTTMIALTAGLAVLAIYRHRTNIRRLLAGTEPRMGSPGERRPS